MRLCQKCSSSFQGVDWHCPSCGWQPPRIAGFPALAPDFAVQGARFKAEDFGRLARLESGNFWFRSRTELIVWALRRYFPLAESFLEIGCGTAFVLSGIAAAKPTLRLTGTEIFCQGLEFASARVPRAELVQMDARHIPYVSEFDAIGAFDVLEHIAEDEDVLRNVAKALKPSGGLLLTVPQHEFLWSEDDELAEHVRRYKASDLRSKVEGAGFRIVRATSLVSLLLPLMFISRRRKRRPGAGDPNPELTLGRRLDRWLERVMRLELHLIRAGINAPAGGSLLLVAVKA